MKFKLLVGVHEDKNGRYDARDSKRNIVESDHDLVKIFGAEKFRRLGKFVEVDPEDESKVINEDIEVNDSFEDMSIAQLRKFAKDEEIELGEAKSKEEIITVLRNATASA